MLLWLSTQESIEIIEYNKIYSRNSGIHRYGGRRLYKKNSRRV